MSYLFAVFALAHQTSTIPQLPPPDKVVVTVNGHPIKAKEVEAYLWEWNAAQVGQTLGVFEAIRQEAAKNKIVLSDAAVKTQVDLEIQQLVARAPKGTTAATVLKTNGYTRSQIEFRVRAQMMLKQLAAGGFQPANYYKVATLVIRPKSGSSDDLKASLALADTAYSRLLKGEAWGIVLTDTATDAQNIPNQGELGWVDASQFPPTTKAELATLKAGGYTKPVQTPNGIQIFRVEALGKEAKGDDLTQLKSRYQSAAERDILTKLQTSAKISFSF